MYETHQFESRIRRIGGDIDNSEKKAKILEEELNRINE